HVGVLRTPARLVSYELAGGDLALEVDLDPHSMHRSGGPAPAAAELVLVRHGGRAVQTFGAEVNSAGPVLRVHGLVPLARLSAGAERTGRPPAAADGGGAVGWDLYLKPAGRGRISVTFPAQVSEAAYGHGTREIAVERSRYGNVTLAERAPRPVLDEHSWSPKGSLLLRGSYRGQAGDGSPGLTAERRLRLSEQGNCNRRVLRRAFYPLQSRRPLRDAILFVSWNGKQCTDNPRGIADELRRRGDDREHIWVVTDYAAAVPDGGRAVLSGTEEYFEALARCKYVISNDDMQPYFRKREGQIYLQTWHGTPLKKIGFDIGRPQFASGTAYFDRLAADIGKWDMLLSQNPFSTPILRRAFRYEGEICEYGYPRNDVLTRAGTR